MGRFGNVLSASSDGAYKIMESFFEAFINCGHRVFGQKLKPFCLRHCLYLEAIGSPIMRIVNGEEVKIERHDLEVAAIICSADGDILKALTRPHFTMFFYSFRRALKEYLDYLTDYLALPEMWDNSESGTRLNAPWILSRATLLLSKTNLTLSEIWNMPLGELLWYCAAFAEQEGGAQILSDDEKKIIAEAEKLKNGK